MDLKSAQNKRLLAQTTFLKFYSTNKCVVKNVVKNIWG